MNKVCPSCRKGMLSVRVVDVSFKYEGRKYDQETFNISKKMYYERVKELSKGAEAIIVCDKCSYAKRF